MSADKGKKSSMMRFAGIMADSKDEVGKVFNEILKRRHSTKMREFEF